MKKINIFLFTLVLSLQSIKSHEIEIDKLKNILIEIETKFFPKKISLDIIDSPKKVCRAYRDNILISKSFLESMKYFENNEIKAIMCHEISHILSHDLDYKQQKEKDSFSINVKFSSNYTKYWVDEKGKRVKDLTFNTEETNSTSYDINKTVDIDKFFEFNIETEKNADILAWDCLNKLNVSNPQEVLKGMLRTIRSHFWNTNEDVVLRLKAIKEISCE